MTSHEMHCDFETRSDVNLMKRGTGPYFESPHWKALGLTYSIDGQELRNWECGQPLPEDLAEAIKQGYTIVAHNASFERQCFEQLHARLGWPLPDISQYDCTAVRAAGMSLPRSLEYLGDALALCMRKDGEGKRLIQKFSVPRRARESDPDPDGVYFNELEDFPEDNKLFIEYRMQDVRTEENAAHYVMRLPELERRVYTLDQVINSRGIRIDVESACAALEIAEKEKKLLDERMRLLTGGKVKKCTQVAVLRMWLKERGVDMESLGKQVVKDTVDAGVPDDVKLALELRQDAGKTSVSKIKTMLARASADGRVRNSYMMYGAGTGRWTSTGVNFANMPRPRKEYEDAHLHLDTLFAMIRQRDPDLLRFVYGDSLGKPLHLISDAIRSFVIAAPKHKFMQGDYTSIEGCVIAWSSGEQWKLDALEEIFEDPDNRPDMYRRTAAQIMGMTTDEITKKHPYRQSIGKVSELALGFGGGVGAYYSMSRIYGVDLDMLHDPVWALADDEDKERAAWRYASALKRGVECTDVMSEKAWLACELVKIGWRKTNAAIAAGWRLREDAVREAIKNPGDVQKVLNLKYLVRGGFLWTQLPSGRCLAYGNPRLTPQVKVRLKQPDGTWGEIEPMDRDEAMKLEPCGAARIEGETTPRISAMSVDSATKRWSRTHLYGGKLAENDTQAIARDILVNGMFKVEEAGYKVVAHVYDELIAEVPQDFGSVEDFCSKMCDKPDWAAGLPLAADGWQGKRYRK